MSLVLKVNQSALKVFEIVLFNLRTRAGVATEIGDLISTSSEWCESIGVRSNEFRAWRDLREKITQAA